MKLQVIRDDGTEVQPGDEVVSRTGEVWILIAAAHASTPDAFGKIAVRRPLTSVWGTPSESGSVQIAPAAAAGSVFTDFAFGLTVRQVS